MQDESSRPHRKPPSVVVEKWGIVQAWLAPDPKRSIVVSAGMHGLRVTVIDPAYEEQVESVAEGEDPSSAALRAIGRFSSMTPRQDGEP